MKKDLKWEKIEGSSTVSAFHYEHKNKELRITFTSGATYLYKDVPPIVIDMFRTAESPGKFIHSDLKNKYESERLI